MLADPIRGRFAGISIDGIVMPALAAVTIQITSHPKDLLTHAVFLPSPMTPGTIFWLLLFSVTSHTLFSYSFLHRYRTRSRTMLAFVLLSSTLVVTYLLAFYLVMLHRDLSYKSILAIFFTLSLTYQAIIYKHRSYCLFKHRQTVMILGNDREAQKIWKHIRLDCNRFIVFRGFVSEATTKDAAPDILARTVCTIESLQDYLRVNIIDTLVLTANARRDLKFAKQAITVARQSGVRLLCTKTAYEDLQTSDHVRELYNNYVDFERPSATEQILHFIKRSADRIIAASALIFMLPLALPLLFIYQLILGKLPLVGEATCGYHRRVFTMWTVRTEYNDYKTGHSTSDNNVMRFRVRLAQKLGIFLQASGLFHAPRLWNVCTGEMSLVGPLPLPPEQACTSALRRYTVLPGLCSPESSAYERSAAAAQNDEVVTLSYLQHWSLSLDWCTFKHWMKTRGRRTANALSAVLLRPHSTMDLPIPRSR